MEEKRNERVDLVTGAAGFVGQNVVSRLVDKGHRVRAMVHNMDKAEDIFNDLPVEVMEADLRNTDSLAKAVKGVANVYSIASIFRQAGIPDHLFYDVNVEGIRNLFEASIAAGVERVVHCSTVGVHGDVESPPANEDSPFNPGDIYQRTKLEGEKVAREYYKSGKISGAVIRPAMIYGPGDARTLKIFKMISKGRFFYVGDGMCSVHFIDVRDLARAFILAMENDSLENGEVYIIAGGKAVPLKEMADSIAEKLGVRKPSLHLPVKPMQWLGTCCETVCKPLKIDPPIFRRRVDFFTKNRHFDTAKARRDLGFEPAQSFTEELDDIIAWYKEHNWI